mmetsp:Transcript_35222/g.109186  ORF Transcript_35222/g.109186 Transcript_35222/m.109186 type:complete len:230 (-) Transcript_35222:2168-2857(-)
MTCQSKPRIRCGGWFMTSLGPMLVTRQPTSTAALMARLQFSTTLNVALRSAALPRTPKLMARASTESGSTSAMRRQSSTPSAQAAKSGGSVGSCASGSTALSLSSPPKRELITSANASASSELKECCELPAPWRMLSWLMDARRLSTRCASDASDRSMASNSSHETSPSLSWSTWRTIAAICAAERVSPTFFNTSATSACEMRPLWSASNASNRLRASLAAMALNAGVL